MHVPTVSDHQSCMSACLLIAEWKDNSYWNNRKKPSLRLLLQYWKCKLWSCFLHRKSFFLQSCNSGSPYSWFMSVSQNLHFRKYKSRFHAWRFEFLQVFINQARNACLSCHNDHLGCMLAISLTSNQIIKAVFECLCVFPSCIFYECHACAYSICPCGMHGCTPVMRLVCRKQNHSWSNWKEHSLRLLLQNRKCNCEVTFCTENLSVCSLEIRPIILRLLACHKLQFCMYEYMSRLHV